MRTRKDNLNEIGTLVSCLFSVWEAPENTREHKEGLVNDIKKTILDNYDRKIMLEFIIKLVTEMKTVEKILKGIKEDLCAKN